MARLTLEQLAAVLVEAGRLKPEQVPNLLNLWGDRLRRAGPARLDPMGFLLGLHIPDAANPEEAVDELLLARTLAQRAGLPVVRLDPLKLDIGFVQKTVSRPFAAKYLILPFGEQDGALQVAVADPFDMEGIELLKTTAGKPVRRFVSPYGTLVRLIHELYGLRASLSKAEWILQRETDLGNLEQLVHLKSEAEIEAGEKHVVNAVEYLLHHAYDLRASDIHLEPKRDEAWVRFRIDGVLHTIATIPKVVYPAVVNHVKTLARMDISEKRRPQDGRIKTEREGKEVELRISSVPVAFGEKLVLRIFDPDMLIRDLESLGFRPDELELFEEFIQRPHGIILVTGPTGSGKTTTLYSALKVLAQPGVNVTTIEDPIEMVMPALNQIAVNPKIGLTFGSALRTILRQDPDIIMVGEIRDRETAENAVQAALTGHLVLSTLHTNDAPSTISRLMNMGIEPFLVATSVHLIQAQRLVRRICRDCKEEVSLPKKALLDLGFTEEEVDTVKVYKGRGCPTCNNSGYKGRTALMEVMEMSDQLREMVLMGANAVELKRQALEEGMLTLRRSGLVKISKGITTVEEVVRETVL